MLFCCKKIKDPMGCAELLKTNLGAELKSVYVYYEFLGDPDQQSLLVVLENFVLSSSFSKLKGKIPYSIKCFTKTELLNSADVFPLEFLELHDRKTLLIGEDVLGELVIDGKNIRQQCEFYLRSTVLRVRDGLLRSTQSPKNLVKQSVPMVLSVLKYLFKSELSSTCSESEILNVSLSKIPGPFPFIKGIFEQTDISEKSLEDYVAFLAQITAFCDQQKL